MYRLRLITFVYEAVAHRADRLRSFTFPGGSGEGALLRTIRAKRAKSSSAFRFSPNERRHAVTAAR